MRATELHFVWSPLRLVWVSSLVPLFVHHVLLKLKKFLEISEAFQEVRNLKFQYVVPEAGNVPIFSPSAKPYVATLSGLHLSANVVQNVVQSELLV